MKIYSDTDRDRTLHNLYTLLAKAEELREKSDTPDTKMLVEGFQRIINDFKELSEYEIVFEGANV